MNDNLSPSDISEEEARFVFYAACLMGVLIVGDKTMKFLKKRRAQKKIDALDPETREKVLDMLAVHAEHNL